MENQMETTIVYWGLYGDNGKENGNHYSLGFRLLAASTSQMRRFGGDICGNI